MCFFSVHFLFFYFFFFFQAEDGIRDTSVTGVQTCALPIFADPDALATKDHPTRSPDACDGRSIVLRRAAPKPQPRQHPRDRKSTRLNSSHRCISYAVFCLKKKKKTKPPTKKPIKNINTHKH